MTSAEAEILHMALKNDTQPDDTYDFSKMIENSHLVLLDEPLTVNCSTGNFEGNVYQFSSLEDPLSVELSGSINSLEENHQVDEGLAMLEILYSTNSCTPSDQPDLINIDNLTCLEGSNKEGSPIVISDDEDVIFMGAFEESSEKKDVDDVVEEEKEAKNSIRRNPVRSARNKSRDLLKELIFEEDFAFLDTSEDEEEEKENKIPEKSASPKVETFKEWPINVHERPEYNIETKKVESFDYTIREIQKKASNKKPKLENVPVKRKKSKKTYFSRRRKLSVITEERKFLLEDLKDLVNSATDMLKEYVERSREHTDLVGCESGTSRSEKRLEALRNQVLLYTLVNNLDQNDIISKFPPPKVS